MKTVVNLPAQMKETDDTNLILPVFTVANAYKNGKLRVKLIGKNIQDDCQVFDMWTSIFVINTANVDVHNIPCSSCNLQAVQCFINAKKAIKYKKNVKCHNKYEFVGYKI